MTNDTRLPKPELRGVGRILYRCATCGELMEPTDAVVTDGIAYHPDHAPERTTDGR